MKPGSHYVNAKTAQQKDKKNFLCFDYVRLLSLDVKSYASAYFMAPVKTRLHRVYVYTPIQSGSHPIRSSASQTLLYDDVTKAKINFGFPTDNKHSGTAEILSQFS